MGFLFQKVSSKIKYIVSLWVDFPVKYNIQFFAKLYMQQLLRYL